MNLESALNTFLEESRELLEQMEGILLAAESRDPAPDDLHALFRCAHTIKGSAGLFGLDQVVAFTHGVETVLDRLRNGEVHFDPGLAALLLECKDHIAALVAGKAGGDAGLAARLQVHGAAASLPKEAAGAEGGEGAGCPGDGPGRWHLSLRFGPDVLRNGMDPLALVHYLGGLGRLAQMQTCCEALPGWDEYDPESCYLGFDVELESDAPQADIEAAFDFVRDDAEIRILPSPGGTGGSLAAPRVAPPAASSPLESPAPAEPGRPQGGDDGSRRAGRSIKVPAERLDQLIDLVGELVIAGAATRLQAGNSGRPELKEAAANLLGLVEDIRDVALRLRMVPIGEVFSRFHRVVRDVSRELGKDIRLEISGADAELDKSMVDKIAEPLTHLVRNAIDHGIEPEADRRARGKPVQGTVRLDARHEGGNIVIEVGDDGGGLDCDRILQKARQRGLVSPDQSLSRQEIFRLVLEPGFSTADRVTEISGRGVGMDVVKSSVEALRGTLDIDSEAGQGTTMRIGLPLTLAIIDGFQVALEKRVYIVPLDAVVECIELPADHQADYLNLRGEILPLVRLGQLFQSPPAAGRQNVVVVRAGDRKAGLLVDRLLGESQAVIKPLSKVFRRLQGIGGSTILGNGQVALILDVPALLRLAAGAGVRAGQLSGAC